MSSPPASTPSSPIRLYDSDDPFQPSDDEEADFLHQHAGDARSPHDQKTSSYETNSQEMSIRSQPLLQSAPPTSAPAPVGSGYSKESSTKLSGASAKDSKIEVPDSQTSEAMEDWEEAKPVHRSQGSGVSRIPDSVPMSAVKKDKEEQEQHEKEKGLGLEESLGDLTGSHSNEDAETEVDEEETKDQEKAEDDTDIAGARDDGGLSGDKQEASTKSHDEEGEDMEDDMDDSLSIRPTKILPDGRPDRSSKWWRRRIEGVKAYLQKARQSRQRLVEDAANEVETAQKVHKEASEAHASLKAKHKKASNDSSKEVARTKAKIKKAQDKLLEEEKIRDRIFADDGLNVISAGLAKEDK